MTRQRRSPPWTGVLLVVFLGALVLWPVIFSGALKGRAGSDQVLFHGPSIRAFAAQWPRFDFRDYWSATTPGYHVALAAVARVWPDVHRAWLQWFGSLFALGTLAAVARAATLEMGAVRHAAIRVAFVLLPLLASVYFVHAGIWLLPDNAGWLMVGLALALALWRVRAGPEPTRPRQAAWLLDCALVVLGVVFVRQSHVWVAGVLMAAAFVGRMREGESAAVLARGVGTRIGRVALVAIACVPAAMLLWRFAELWEGLTPPRFQGQHASGMNPATPALALALLAVYSMFFIGFWAHGLRRLWRLWPGRAILFIAALAGLALAAIPETTYFIESRMGGLWQLVGALERRGVVVAGRTSPVFVVLAPIGALAACGWAASMRGPRALVLMAALAGFIAAQTANPNAWQRYLEPGLLILVALMSAGIWADAALVRCASHAPLKRRRQGDGRIDWPAAAGALRWLGPAALAALLGAVTLVQTLGAQDIDPEHPPPIPPYVYTGPLP